MRYLIQFGDYEVVLRIRASSEDGEIILKVEFFNSFANGTPYGQDAEMIQKEMTNIYNSDGFYLVSGFIRLMGGTLNVAVTNEGTFFHFLLNIKEVKEASPSIFFLSLI